ncbi:hypothetical protein BC834DRAFT_873254 [Gloeopeniophorella convolvens]|nr:hypothetical protein BC834DRAFT_873254 [Gloeopeniophorella convolvens]
MRGALRVPLRALSPRDAILILLGAASMNLFSFFFAPTHESSIVVNTHVSSQDHLDVPPGVQDALLPVPLPPSPPAAHTPDVSRQMPFTELVSHAPGWTIFRNLYMADGTLFILTDDPESFPDIKFMTSTGLPALNTPESIAERMPTSRDMSFISPAEARRRWVGIEATKEPNRIYPVEGSTFLLNDPGQFLNHYYHFCAELIFGAWAFWYGTFTGTPSSSSVPPFARIIFPHAHPEEWRDGPGMNFFFLRAAWPSLAVETRPDWQDRVLATALRAGKPNSRAWWFDTVLLADRSAAFRGPECGERTQRTAAEAIKGVVERAGRTGFLERGWWESVRHEVLRFAGVDSHTLDIGTRAFKRAERGSPATGGVENVVITYISRQGVRRHLVDEDHDGLVRALVELCDRRGWELNVAPMERLSKEEQLALVARTTFLLGVHGNGLTHLIMMPLTPISTVIELFYPTGYAHDYEWTTRALGMKHFAVWNDTSTTYPEVTWPNYPDGFQGSQIPVHGPYVAKLIEDRADGKLP